MTGRFTTKGNRYYMILNLKDASGRYKPKWIRTGLCIHGNQECAQVMLERKLKEFDIAVNTMGGKTNFSCQRRINFAGKRRINFAGFNRLKDVEN